MRQQFKMMLIFVLALAVSGVSQFLVFATVAIMKFPERYSFTGNFLSELGRLSNQHHAIYNGSLIFLGISLMPSFAMLWLINIKGLWSLKATTIFGVISAFGLIGMGLFTFDREFLLHYLALALWLFPMLYMTVCFFFAVSRSDYIGIGFLSASLLMVVTMLVILLQTRVTSLQLLHLFVVLCGFIWLIYVIAYIYQSGIHLLKNWDHIKDHSAEEAEYFSTLVRDERRQ